jgi:hypothetical protein
MVTAAEAKAIDDWRYTHRVPTRAEAIRQLIDMGIRVPMPASDLANMITPAILRAHPDLAIALQALKKALREN